MTPLQKELFALQDPVYRDFTAKLIPTVDRERIIGIRTPVLRSFARSYAGQPGSAAFMRALPHFYLEENSLHAFLIEGIRSYGECVAALDAFLPCVDNWAVCDSIKPRCLKRHPDLLVDDVRRWMRSDMLYTVRFGIGMLMAHFLDENFRPGYLDLVADIRTEEYYLRMMQAWYFATALAKQYEAALPYLESRRLEPWTHNRAIQKAVESYRISEEQKAYLRTLKIRRGG